MGLGSFLKKTVTSLIPGGGLIEALAPVVAKGVGTLISSKQGKAEQKQLEEQRRLEAQRADQLARQQWEAQVNSPQAQAARFKNTLQYGRLAAGLGGLDKVPKSLSSYYESARKMPEYTGTSSYIPTPKKGGTGWDIASGIAGALGYLDTEKLKRGKSPGQPTGGYSGFGGNSSFGSEGGAAAAPSTNPLVGLTQRIKGTGLDKPKY